jgi:hypothetical protein
MSFLNIPKADNTNIKLAKSAVSAGTGVFEKASITEISHTKATKISNNAISYLDKNKEFTIPL